MLAKMIDKIVSLKETKIFEIGGQTYADASLTRIPPHVDRPDCISVSGLDSICKKNTKPSPVRRSTSCPSAAVCRRPT